jgi:hypothetical protein
MNRKSILEKDAVVDDARWLNSARCRQHEFGFRIVDAFRELRGGKTTKDDGMDRAQARASEPFIS